VHLTHWWDWFRNRWTSGLIKIFTYLMKIFGWKNRGFMLEFSNISLISLGPGISCSIISFIYPFELTMHQTLSYGFSNWFISVPFNLSPSADLRWFVISVSLNSVIVNIWQAWNGIFLEKNGSIRVRLFFYESVWLESMIVYICWGWYILKTRNVILGSLSLI